jgi:creatine kinase
MNKMIPFARSDKYGFLTYCPSNLGTTLRASVHMKLPLLSANQEMFKCVCAKYNIQARGRLLWIKDGSTSG